jgi:predicted transcriptional regulator
LPSQNIVRLDTISFQYASGYSNHSVMANQTGENFSYTKEELTQMILNNATAAVIINSTNLTNDNIVATAIEEKISGKINTTENAIKTNKENKSNFTKDALIVLVLVIVLGFFLGIGYLFIKQGSVVIDNAIEEHTPSLKKSKRVLETKVKNIMIKLSFVSQKEPISEAISQLISSGNNCIFVIKDGEYYGYIKEKNIINYQEGFEKKISESQSLIHKENIVLDSRKTIAEAFQLMNDLDITRLVVKEGNKIIGEVCAIEILRLFSGIKLSQELKNSQDIPIIRDILDKECPTVDKEAKILEINKIILEQNNEIVLVRDEKYIGEITSNDLIAQMAKCGPNFKENKAGQVMASIHAVNPDSDIFDAAEYILGRGFSSYPVIINDTLLGIIRPMRLIEEMIKYLNNK